jgi:predicted DNA-binding transcriptional regulator AlpA
MPNERILTVKETARITSLSRSTLYRLKAERRFPDAIRIAPNRVGFKLSLVLEWLASRENT